MKQVLRINDSLDSHSNPGNALAQCSLTGEPHIKVLWFENPSTKALARARGNILHRLCQYGPWRGRSSRIS